MAAGTAWVVPLALLLTQVVATALGAPQAKAPQTPPPFQLTPAEGARLDKILVAWQQASGRVKTFEAGFTRFEYDRVFGTPDQPKTTEKGEVKFASPNRGLFSVGGPQPEKWLCDGKSLFVYDFRLKSLTEFKLPPELRGSAVPDLPQLCILGWIFDPFGPLRFARIFGTPPGQLMQQYYVRAVTPKAEEAKSIWLQFLPRLPRERANFDVALLIIDAKSLQPAAARIYLPGGKTNFTFVFENVRVNDPHGLTAKAFDASTPPGWRRVVE